MVDRCWVRRESYGHSREPKLAGLLNGGSDDFLMAAVQPVKHSECYN